MKEDNRYIVKGLPPLVNTTLSEGTSLGKYYYERLSAIKSNAPLLIDAITEESISANQLLTRTCTLARKLTRFGYGPNTIIAIFSENSLEYFVPVIAAQYIGATVTTINPNYTKQELVHVLNITKPDVLFCSETSYENFEVLKDTVTFIKRVFIIGVKSENEGEITEFNPVDVEIEEQVGFILTSSGTTGLPKGVMLKQISVLTILTAVEDPRYDHFEGGAVIAILPFFHAYGLFLTLYNILRNNLTITLSRFDPQVFLRTIEKYKIQFLPLVPPLAVFFTKSPLVQKYDLSSVTQTACGAAPLSKETEIQLKERLRISNVQKGYGLTETTLAVTRTLKNNQKPGTCGRVVPRMQCKVRNPETGESLGPNQVGELCFKGVFVMKGYYNNEEATRNSFTSDGWLLTGDLGYYDQDEDFFIVDRLKELIKYKGFQVAPAELEAVLLTHPGIQDAGVVGLPNEEDGERPVAFVVIKSGCVLSENDVKRFVEERVSPQKKLRGGVIFLDEIPKNPSGKILRRELRELLKKHKAKL